MTLTQQIITIALCALATALTRFLPFLIFSSARPAPRFIQYLGGVLPGAIFGMLIVFCLKDVNFLGGTHGLPEFIALGVTVGLHLWKRNMLLSIAAGTACYMVLLQTGVFG